MKIAATLTAGLIAITTVSLLAWGGAIQLSQECSKRGSTSPQPSGSGNENRHKRRSGQDCGLGCDCTGANTVGLSLVENRKPVGPPPGNHQDLPGVIQQVIKDLMETQLKYVGLRIRPNSPDVRSRRSMRVSTLKIQSIEIVVSRRNDLQERFALDNVQIGTVVPMDGLTIMFSQRTLDHIRQYAAAEYEILVVSKSMKGRIGFCAQMLPAR